MIINSQDVGNEIARRLGAGGDVKALQPSVETVESYLAFTRKRDYSSVADAYDEALKRMIEDGTYATLYY